VRLTLLDWRRRVTELYASARAAGSPESGWQMWRSGRAALFRDHPDSPLREGAALPAYRPYDRSLRLPVWDPTCGRESYGGGRYVLDTVKGADLGSIDGRLVVDLNYAYNPSCAYDPAWACPLPQAGNRLDVSVHAGELAP
jgi:uncharacterized protein (DUF1684 family)